MTEHKNFSSLNSFAAFLAVMAFAAFIFSTCAVSRCSSPSSGAGVASSLPAPPAPPDPPHTRFVPESPPVEPYRPSRPAIADADVPRPPVPEAIPPEPAAPEIPEPPPPDPNLKKRLDDLLGEPSYDSQYVDAVYVRNVSKSPIKVFVHTGKGSWDPRILKPSTTVYLTSTDRLRVAYEVPGKGYRTPGLMNIYHQPHFGNAPVQQMKETALLYEIDRVDEETLSIEEKPNPVRGRR